MRFALAILLCAASVLRADTVTGMVQSVGFATVPAQRIIFQPLSTPANIGGVFTHSASNSVFANTNGWFSNRLAGPMYYRVSVGAHPRDVMTNYVPGTGGTYDWLGLSTNASIVNTASLAFVAHIAVGGTNIGNRGRLNFVPGSNTVVRATNNSSTSSIDVQINAASSAAAATNIAPIGSVIAWLKSFSGTPALPAGWVECNGQVLSDSGSVYNGATIPDLNGGFRFLRGFSASGVTGGTDTHSHTAGASVGAAGGSDVFAWDASAPSSTDNHLPPYYTVVWILRVK